jgi:biopolymer transport protein ExbB/TolQ
MHQQQLNYPNQHAMPHRILGSIDYLSILFVGISLASIGTVFGILAAISTIVYNIVRTRSELKEKKAKRKSKTTRNVQGNSQSV